MTYRDIVQRVYDELAMPDTEIVRAGYSGKVHRIFNEATFKLAHAILPNLREYRVVLSSEKLPAKIIMPPDFISFADEQHAYVNGDNFVLTNFVGKDGLIVTGKEGDTKRSNNYAYTIYYNALYPKITNNGATCEVVNFLETVDSDAYVVAEYPTDAVDNPYYNWPDIVGNLVPHYIVSRLLVLDDKVRSIEEMNTFETLLATVNVSRNERQREYHSARGWY